MNDLNRDKDSRFAAPLKTLLFSLKKKNYILIWEIFGETFNFLIKNLKDNKLLFIFIL